MPVSRVQETIFSQDEIRVLGGASTASIIFKFGITIHSVTKWCSGIYTCWRLVLCMYSVRVSLWIVAWFSHDVLIMYGSHCGQYHALRCVFMWACSCAHTLITSDPLAYIIGTSSAYERSGPQTWVSMLCTMQCAFSCLFCAPSQLFQTFRYSCGHSCT